MSTVPAEGSRGHQQTPSHSLPGIFMIDSAWLPRTHSQVSCSVCMHCDELPDGLTWLSAEQAKEAWQQRGWHLLRAGADEHLRAGLRSSNTRTSCASRPDAPTNPVLFWLGNLIL